MTEEVLERPSTQSIILTTLTSSIEDIKTNIFEITSDDELLSHSHLATELTHNFFEVDNISVSSSNLFSQNVTAEENATDVTTMEMYPRIDENVGNYIALGFFFAFVVAVVVLVSIVAFCCLKRRQKMKLEKSIVKIENPKYISQQTRFTKDFDFTSQSIRYNNRQDESSSALISSPQITISVDDQSTGTSLYSPESLKGSDKKRLSRSSDYPEASVASLRNDSCSDASREGPESSDGRSQSANHVEDDRPKEGTMKRKAPTPPVDYEPEGNAVNSESLSCPLLGNGESKSFGNRLLTSKESAIIDDDVEEDDDEHDTNQSTLLLKSKERSLLSLSSYDQSLNPFSN